MEHIRIAITNALESLGIAPVDFVVEHPAELSHGDYATNVALVVAKSLGKNPRALADELAVLLRDMKIEHVAAIEVAGAGFINFHFDRVFFSNAIESALHGQDTWGRHSAYVGKRILVEYTDPNPFKEFHIGHLFTNAVGESIARLIMMGGADVKRVNYQGDVGMHVANALWGMQKLGLTVDSDMTARDLGKAYAHGASAYKDDEGAQKEIRVLNKAIYERSDPEVNALYDKGRKVSLDYFETIYQMVGTAFDHYFFESEAAPLGKELVLAHPKVFVESDGAYVFKGEEVGLHTRVFLNAEGLPTYEAKELALAKMKDDLFQYDHSIISTSNEINEYFKVLLAAMGNVFPDLAKKTEHIGHGMVRLASGKMSSRTGDVIAAIDFISEIKEAALEKIRASSTEHTADSEEILGERVAIGAIKFATLKSNILQDTVFDKAQALSFEGDSGPYLQYTYARIISILKKANDAGIGISTELAPSEVSVVEQLLYRFPEVVERATLEREPHYVATYLIELAGAFNAFYAQVKIVDVSDKYAPYRVALASAVAQTLKNGLWVLGIEAPEQM